jgi:hypothetical protein
MRVGQVGQIAMPASASGLRSQAQALQSVASSGYSRGEVEVFRATRPESSDALNGTSLPPAAGAAGDLEVLEREDIRPASTAFSKDMSSSSRVVMA